jgi:AraC-like DNA-binding protein
LFNLLTDKLQESRKSWKRTIAQRGVFCYAGWRIYPHRYIAVRLQPWLTEHNPALEYTINFLSLISNDSGAEVTRIFSTAESPGR